MLPSTISPSAALARLPAVLTFEDAVQVWLIYWKGEFQNRIAARFDCNPARISEVLKGKLHPGSEQVARGLLH